jgi:pantothenate kinase
VKVARELLAKDGRHVLGLTGKPGSGKSTLAAQLVAALGEEAVSVPMDGFHLANRVLGERGLRERKGCVESFDASGYANLLQRICAAGACDIFFPVFHREVEESYAAEGAVTPKHRLVVTDGIWLLHASFSDAQKCLDASVYVEQVPDDKRIQRLIERRMQLAGEERAVATRWATGPDESNAKLVAETRSKAQYILV